MKMKKHPNNIVLSMPTEHIVPLAMVTLLREPLYRQLIRLLHIHRTWLEVRSTDTMQKHTAIRHGRMTDILCRVLVVKSIYPRCPYTRGQEWRISESDLDEAVKHLRHTDKDFGKRASDNSITIDDVERIITLATHGVLRPQLSAFPIFTSLSEYDY